MPVQLGHVGFIFGLLDIEPSLEHVVAVTVLIKTAYFGLVIYAISMLWITWKSSATNGSQGIRWMYLTIGLASIALLLFASGERTYRFAMLEREIRREAKAINSRGTVLLQEGVTLAGVRVFDRAWYYDFGLTMVTASQLDPARFGAAARASLLQTVCTDPWLQQLLSANISVHYLYRDRNDQTIADVAFDRRACVVNR